MRPSSSARSRLLASLSLALISAGCGGAAPPSGAQAPASSLTPPATVEAASANFDQAEKDVRLALGGSPQDLKESGGAPPPPPVSASSAPSAGDAAKPQAPRSSVKSADACQSACPALASMQRAATQLCALTGGDDDARCKSAHERVKHAEQQVHEHCPVCSG